MVSITHSQRSYRLVSPQPAVLTRSKFSVPCPVIVFFFFFVFVFFPWNFKNILLHVNVMRRWHVVPRCSNLGCAKARPGRAGGVAGGDSDSCLEASNTKDSRSDLVENTKNREEPSSGDSRRKRDRTFYSAPVTFKEFVTRLDKLLKAPCHAEFT